MLKLNYKVSTECELRPLQQATHFPNIARTQRVKPPWDIRGPTFQPNTKPVCKKQGPEREPCSHAHYFVENTLNNKNLCFSERSYIRHTKLKSR